ncbi:hypothetical protein ACVWYG_001491 [Pedobacter sp. UYEF25]
MGQTKTIISKVLANSLLIFPSVLIIAFAMHIQSADDLFIFTFKKAVYDSSILFENLIGDGGASFIHSHSLAYFSVHLWF